MSTAKIATTRYNVVKSPTAPPTIIMNHIPILMSVISFLLIFFSCFYFLGRALFSLEVNLVGSRYHPRSYGDYHHNPKNDVLNHMFTPLFVPLGTQKRRLFQAFQAVSTMAVMLFFRPYGEYTPEFSTCIDSDRHGIKEMTFYKKQSTEKHCRKRE